MKFQPQFVMELTATCKCQVDGSLRKEAPLTHPTVTTCPFLSGRQSSHGRLAGYSR